MMQRRSPPKHRHDGTSPLPLGMDWSPPPRKWNGRQTVWPHDPRTGWSYCITIPSWVVLPKSRDSDPVVLKKAFPKKNLPPAPPKGLLRMKSRALLEERRCSLEEWMTKLLSDIEISRSVAIASFLELEAAARTSFQDENQQSSEANQASDSTTFSLPNIHHSSSSLIAGSSSVASDNGSDTACEASELGTPRLGRDKNFEIGVQELSLDDDLTSPIEKLVKFGMSNIDEGLFMGQTILDQLEGLPKHKPQARHVNHVMTKDKYNGSKALFLANDGMNNFSETEPNKGFCHARKLSSESVGSDGSSQRGSEISNSGILNSFGDGSLDIPGAGELLGVSESNADLKFAGDVQIVLPSDQRHRLSRVLQAMQRRLVTAKTDMEDLIARLNQEIAVKDYLSKKVQDLEVELETTKQKNKENLQQAILVERERLTKMQWDMEELKQKSMEMELKLNSKEDEKSRTGLEVESSNQENDMTLQELDSTRKQLEDMSKRYQDLEAKSRADIKFLAKEFKSLKSSETELKQELNWSLKEKSEIEKLLKEEREMREREKDARKKLLQDCRVLCNQLHECNLDLSMEDDDDLVVSSREDVSSLLTTSNDQVANLLAKVQLFAEEDKTPASEHHMRATDDELRNTIVDIFIGNAKLRKQVNSVIGRAFQMGIMSRSNGEATAPKMNYVER